MSIETITKRNGTAVPFDSTKIHSAVYKCLHAGLGEAAEVSGSIADDITKGVINLLNGKNGNGGTVSVEQIQNHVESVLMSKGQYAAAREYILHREQRTKERNKRRPVDELDARFVRQEYAKIPTDLQRYQVVDKYSRWVESKGRREVWSETATRAIQYFQHEVGFDLFTIDEWNEMRDGIISMDALPSMRLLQMSGDAARRCQICTYNCSYLPIKDLRAFAEALYILMQGCGVGFSVESEYIEDLPKIKKQKGLEPHLYIVEDNTESWCNALLFGLERWYAGEDVVFDLHKIRPAGARLKTKGGTSAGADPLRELLDFSRRIILSRQGKRLRTIDCHDICCYIGQIVEVGGVRRAAEISLFDIDDELMRSAKHGEFWNHSRQRTQANNSIVFDEKPTIEKFLETCWLPLIKGGTGEPGIFNREGIQNSRPKRRRRKPAGTNPCLPGFALVLTPDGIKTFDEITPGRFIWTETGWAEVISKWGTGVKPVYKYQTSAGSFIGTSNHRIVSEGVKVEVGEAESIDTLAGDVGYSPLPFIPQVIMDGIVLGDGSVHRASNNLVFLHIGQNDYDYHKDNEIGNLICKKRPGLNDTAWEVETTIRSEELPKTYDRVIPDRYFYGSPKVVVSFLRGLYSANGSICGKRITLKSASRKLVEQTQVMLSAVGIGSYITTNLSHTVAFSNGDYECRESYDLNISTDRGKFSRLVGFIQKYKQSKLDDLVSSTEGGRSKETYEIQKVEYLGDFEVYDITVDNEPHTYWTGGLNISNCGEIALLEFSFCNLSSVVARPEDTLEDLERKVRIAARYGTMQSSLTRFEYLREEWSSNCKDERLLGVDINGWQNNPILRYGSPDRIEAMKVLKTAAVEENQIVAARMGINASVAVTTGKPNGNGSTAVNCDPGIHPAESRWYIRRVRSGRNNPVTQLLQEAGVPWNPEVGQTLEDYQKVVFDFPVERPEGTLTYADMTAEQQFYNWLEVKRHWAEHNVSCTIRVKPNEWLALGALVYEYWDEVGGLSFLPLSDHIYRLQPYQSVTKEEYDKLVSEFPVIDWSRLSEYEYNDTTEVGLDFACTGLGCAL